MMYDLITKKGNTYRIDEPTYKGILNSIKNGKMFVMVGTTLVNTSNIAEIPKAKLTEVDIPKTNRLPEGERKPVDINSPGYKKFLEARKKLIRKLGLK